jgi:hypothetical protein
MEPSEQQGQAQQPQGPDQAGQMAQRGYERYSELRPDEPVEAEMANEEGTEYWTGTLDPVQTHGPQPVWWRPARSKDDLWIELMSMKEASGAKIRWHPTHKKELPAR